jgi:transketolase
VYLHTPYKYLLPLPWPAQFPVPPGYFTPFLLIFPPFVPFYDTVLYERGSVQVGLGKGITAREGSDVTIFAHGEMVLQALEAANELAKENISVRVADMYCIKPIDKELIVSCIKETGRIVVLEDHLMEGGLASAIADVIADSGISPKAFKRLGIPQIFAGFGSGPELRDKYGYGLKATIEALRKIVTD